MQTSLQKVHRRGKELDWTELDEILPSNIMKSYQSGISDSYKATAMPHGGQEGHARELGVHQPLDRYSFMECF